MLYLNVVWHTSRSITLGKKVVKEGRCQRRNATESRAPILWWREDASWAPRNATTASSRIADGSKSERGRHMHGVPRQFWLFR